jgi:hypothetical protein
VAKLRYRNMKQWKRPRARAERETLRNRKGEHRDYAAEKAVDAERYEATKVWLRERGYLR